MLFEDMLNETRLPMRSMNELNIFAKVAVNVANCILSSQGIL